MTSTSNTSKSKTILLASQDSELIAMARGAFGSSGDCYIDIQKISIADISSQIRDPKYDAAIIDMDTNKVEDFENLQRIKRTANHDFPIIVVSSRFSAPAARILIQLKVSDFLVKPMKTSDFVRSVNNTLKSSDEANQIDPQFLTFMSSAGGVGNTVIALETAAILHKSGKALGRSTCVVDLNFQQGCCAEYLDIEPRFNINEIESAPERLDRQMLDVMIAHHKSGLSLIAAPIQPSEMRSFKPVLVLRLLDLVSAYFDFVVIDMPRHWFPWTEAVLAGSNKVFITSDMTVPSIRHAKRLVSAIDEKVGKQIAPKIIVNRAISGDSNGGLTLADAEQTLGDTLVGTIPNNYQLVRESVDRGVLLAEIDPSNNVSAAIASIILPKQQDKTNKASDHFSLASIGRKLLGKKAA